MSARPRHASNPNDVWARLIVEELVRSGVDFFCLAPGSRSTPLTTAVARHADARSIMHFDERGTAFCALGHARATGRPAAWITTSGTAAANGMPAVVEASVDGVPLILLTADRPPELRDTSANQTIDQVKLYGDYVRWQFDMPAPSEDVAPAMVLTTVDQAVYHARRPPAGPVHLNCMFRKPLAPSPRASAEEISPLPSLAGWRDRSTPYTQHDNAAPRIAEEEIAVLWDGLRRVERGLLVVGRLPSFVSKEPIQQLAERLQWPLLPDVASGLRFDSVDGAAPFYDQVLTHEDFADSHQPEAVLHLGGRFISKRLLRFLERSRPSLYAVVHESPSRIDPNHQVTRRLEMSAGAFCASLLSHADSSPSPSWTADWLDASRRAGDAISSFVGRGAPISEPLTARLVSRHLPDGHGLVLANSMPIRDVNRYAAPDGSSGPVATNRGASGIDGTVATAAGFALGLEAPVTLLIGDLALLHDFNSLALLKQLPVPVVIVVVNNGGGGIFSFLPIAQHDDVFEPFFGTPHDVTFADGAAQFDLCYHRPSDADDFARVYREACQLDGPSLIEVTTDRRANKQLHEGLERRIRKAVADELNG